MPRKLRQKSSTGLYHVIWRGNNRQEMFHDQEDYEYFIHLLDMYRYADRYDVRSSKFREYKNNYSLICFCLMSNHFHALIKEEDMNISASMKRIGISYVAYYNKKYTHTGGVFEGRFTSEPCENDAYLLQLLRYIHRNPVKAGIVENVEDYAWSSWNFYNGGLTPFDKKICDLKEVTSRWSLEKVREFVLEESENQESELLEPAFHKLNAEECKEIMYRISGCTNLNEFTQLDKSVQKTCIRAMRVAGMIYEQITMYTGWSIGRIRYLMKN